MIASHHYAFVNYTAHISLVEHWKPVADLAFLPPQAFVDFFSRGLQSEYKSKGIIIQVNQSGCFFVVVVVSISAVE